MIEKKAFFQKTKKKNKKSLSIIITSLAKRRALTNYERCFFMKFLFRLKLKI
jgi:hypothetical protein